MANRIADNVDLSVPLRFMRDDADIVDTIGRQICQTLDVQMAEQFADLYFDTFGAASSPSPHLRTTRVIMNRFAGREAWPALDVAALVPHLDTRSDNLAPNRASKIAEPAWRKRNLKAVPVPVLGTSG